MDLIEAQKIISIYQELAREIKPLDLKFQLTDENIHTVMSDFSEKLDLIITASRHLNVRETNWRANNPRKLRNESS